MRCVELYAGAGGMAEGLRQGGWEHLLLVEKDPRACRTLEANGFANVLCGGVEEVDYAPLRGKADLVCGGPPCQPWSIAGRSAGPEDARNGWEEAVRAVREVRPSAFLFENVAGMARPRFAAYVRVVLDAFRSLGYGGVRLCETEASRHGIAQRRRRVFVVGFLHRAAADAFAPPSPSAGPPVTVREVLASLGPPSEARRAEGHALHPAAARAYRGHTGSSPDAPSKTIVAGSGRGVPGGANTIRLEEGGALRYYTVREAARLQTFPDGYALPSTWSVAFVQLGNAVPCELARLWGRSVEEALAITAPRGRCSSRTTRAGRRPTGRSG